ncbi:hypothetical protein V2O64_24615 (plasmid) [Verrucomicrobiaceae bacterium 227]
MSITQHTIETPLGGVTVRVLGLDSSGCSIDLLTPTIELPPGMSVDGVVAAMIQVPPTRSASAVRCECVWDQAPASADPESGECLDAQSWDSNGHRVTVGTEDCDALCHRLPELGFTEDQYPVAYSEDGLSIMIPDAAAGSSFSLHFVVAWRSLPDPADCSTWFAVDIPHAKLEAANKTSILTPDPPRVEKAKAVQPSTLKSERAPGQA